MRYLVVLLVVATVAFTGGYWYGRYPMFSARVVVLAWDDGERYRVYSDFSGCSGYTHFLKRSLHSGYSCGGEKYGWWGIWYERPTEGAK